MSGALATASWQESCETFQECYIMPPEERARMAEIATPAWREWIVDDFGLDGDRVDAFLEEVERVRNEVAESDIATYGRWCPEASCCARPLPGAPSVR